MSIFQISVINKYLKTLDDEKVTKARQQFDEFYGNKIRLHNIMQLKEENYQEGFLRQIFVDVLKYTINPNFNHTIDFFNKLTISQQDEREDYFDTYKQDINKIQNHINQTDKEIDRMVYKLYDLTPEDIEIEENNIN